MRARHGLMLLAAAAALGTACSGDYGSAPTGPSTSNAIDVRDNSFSPGATTVPVGTTVTWTWRGGNPHNVAFSDGVKSATQTSGTYTRTFTAAGTYSYLCEVHGRAMSGTVTVQ